MNKNSKFLIWFGIFLYILRFIPFYHEITTDKLLSLNAMNVACNNMESIFSFCSHVPLFSRLQLLISWSVVFIGLYIEYTRPQISSK